MTVLPARRARGLFRPVRLGAAGGARRSRPVVAALAMVGLCAAVAAVVPAPALAAPSEAVTWGVVPSTAKGPNGRATFVYDLRPGTVVHDYAGLSNNSGTPQTFHIYASDAVTTPQGGYDVLPGDKAPTDVGAWVRLARSSITVPAHALANIPFTLSVPANATPGDHPGGIVASLRRPAAAGGVRVEQRVGARVYLRVPGTLTPTLTVTNVHTTYHGTINPFGGGGMTVSYTVVNTGNVRLGVAQRVSARSGFGTTLASATPPTLPELVPGASLRMSATLSGVFPLGPVNATVTLTPRLVAGDTTTHLPGPTDKGTSGWAVPWPQLALLALLVAAGWLVWRQRRRRFGRIQGAIDAAFERGRREAHQATPVGAQLEESR